MLLSEYTKSDHPKQRNPVVECNALYKTEENLNCYLTPAQAIALARNLLEKAQLILDQKLEDAAVQLWNQGKENERLYCGLIQARKGPRRGRPQPKSTAETL
jgi:hypothetical protein